MVTNNWNNFLSINNEKTLKIMNNDTKKLLEKANDILELENVEVVDIKITFEKKKIAEAEVIKYIKTSEDRINPKCPYY